jgi:hypothetical protein
MEIPAPDPFRVAVEVPLQSPDGPAEGMALVDLALARTGQHEVFKARTATSLRTTVEEVLASGGTLTFPGGFSFDLSSAEATLVTARTSFSDPDGGRPAGQVPVNDGVRSALPLVRGDTVKGVWTGGAALMPEETFSESLGHTVWYRIDGDGAPVTVDTGGSDFDTVISLHRDAGDGLEPLGEFDDEIIGRTDAALLVQARTTFETETGVAYYVQVGGFAYASDGGMLAERGRLRVAVSGG